MYDLTEMGRALTWTAWKNAGGCGLSAVSTAEVGTHLGRPEAAWSRDGTTLGQIADACPWAGREIARFAADNLNRPEWAVPHKH